MMDWVGIGDFQQMLVLFGVEIVGQVDVVVDMGEGFWFGVFFDDVQLYVDIFQWLFFVLCVYCYGDCCVGVQC